MLSVYVFFGSAVYCCYLDVSAFKSVIFALDGTSRLIILLSEIEHEFRPENVWSMHYTKQLLMIDQHPSIRLEQFGTDLLFRFSFNQTICLNIPPSLKNDLFIIGQCEYIDIHLLPFFRDVEIHDFHLV